MSWFGRCKHIWRLYQEDETQRSYICTKCHLVKVEMK